MCSGAPCRAGPGHDRVHVLRRHRADRVDGRAGPGVRGEHAVVVRAERLGPGRPPRSVAVAEPDLRAGQRQHPGLVEAAGQVAGVEQGDPQARLGGRLDQGVTHRVRVGVGRPVRLVVQVVELAHAGDPGQRHLGVDGAGQGEVAVRVEPGGDLVHPLAPGPERAAVRLGGAAQGAVEGVRVRVGEAGEGEAAKALRVGRGGGSGGGDGGEAVAVGFDEDVAADALAGEPGQVGEPAPLGSPRPGPRGPGRARARRLRSRPPRRVRRASARRRSGCGRTAWPSGSGRRGTRRRARRRWGAPGR